MMGYNEASFQEIVTKGLSPAYVTSETKPALAGTGGRVKIFPGSALEAGADGVVLSREYYEMQLENLSAAGETTRKIFAAKDN
jgi:hypothetical protein